MFLGEAFLSFLEKSFLVKTQIFGISLLCFLKVFLSLQEQLFEAAWRSFCKHLVDAGAKFKGDS